MADEPVAPSDGRRADAQAIYAAGSSHWIHADQMRWTILYNFLVGNTILLVAWSTLYAALLQRPSSLGVRIVLIGLCFVGFIGSLVWALLERRANGFSEQYFQAGLRLERQLQVAELQGPFATNEQQRTQGRMIKTYVVVIAVPICFALVYFGLFVVGVYAAMGVL